MDRSVEKPGRPCTGSGASRDFPREDITGERQCRESEGLIVCAEQRVDQEG